MMLTSEFPDVLNKVGAKTLSGNVYYLDKDGKKRPVDYVLVDGNDLVLTDYNNPHRKNQDGWSYYE